MTLFSKRHSETIVTPVGGKSPKLEREMNI